MPLFCATPPKFLRKLGSSLNCLRKSPYPPFWNPFAPISFSHFGGTLGWKEAEYAYLRDSNTETVSEQFCNYCSCNGKADILERMAEQKGCPNAVQHQRSLDAEVG